MKIVIAADHGGFNLKQGIILYLEKKGADVIDCGIYDLETADYPDYAEMAAKEVLRGDADLGILICGTGIGMCISANKIGGIRCALCTDPFMARMARMHNNANMLALGGRVTGCGLAEDIVDAFLNAEFESGGRHERRVAKITGIEKKYGGGNDNG